VLIVFPPIELALLGDARTTLRQMLDVELCPADGVTAPSQVVPW
jgi:hypothetical protein